MPQPDIDTLSHDLWVFGYGSLMWRPGFPYEEAVHARLMGWRRCFCIYSVHYRGTAKHPGLVLGLDRGGVCEGVAFRVAQSNAQQTIRYLRDREQLVGVYREAFVPVTLIKKSRRHVLALTYLAERAHPSYAGALGLVDQARLIRTGRGISGANLEYLTSTLEELKRLGIREPGLERLTVLIGALLARGNRDARPCRVFEPGPRRGKVARVDASRFRQDQRQRFKYRRMLSSIGV